MSQKYWFDLGMVHNPIHSRVWAKWCRGHSLQCSCLRDSNHNREKPQMIQHHLAATCWVQRNWVWWLVIRGRRRSSSQWENKGNKTRVCQILRNLSRETAPSQMSPSMAYLWEKSLRRPRKRQFSIRIGRISLHPFSMLGTSYIRICWSRQEWSQKMWIKKR